MGETLLFTIFEVKKMRNVSRRILKHDKFEKSPLPIEQRSVPDEKYPQIINYFARNNFREIAPSKSCKLWLLTQLTGLN